MKNPLGDRTLQSTIFAFEMAMRAKGSLKTFDHPAISSAHAREKGIVIWNITADAIQIYAGVQEAKLLQGQASD